MEKAELKGMFASGNMPAGAEYKAALGDIVQTFPYFQLAQVLFAKQMYDTHEPEASGRIKLASVYAPDRKAMYLLFKANSSTQTKATVVASPKKEEVKYNFVYSSTTAESGEVKHIAPEKENVPTETFIRKEIETKVPVKITPEKPKVVEQKAEPKKVYVSPPIEKKPEETKPEPEKMVDKPLAPSEPIADINLKYSFSSWLKVIPEISVEKKEEVKPVSQKETLNIIDNFLKKVPSISRPKAEFFSPVKAAKMSVAEDDAIVSETLAKIYVTQGNLPKALKAYQTLLLQFPEKKNIFAARIEEIKALIRQNTKPGTK